MAALAFFFPPAHSLMLDQFLVVAAVGLVPPAMPAPAAACTGAGITTVAPCMAKLTIPLAPPGVPLNQGAVYSLQPSSPNIAMLPSPNIPNATWNATSSTVNQSKAVASPTNLRVFELDYLIAATCPGASYCPTASSTIPTITSILGTASNDGVVTLTSQTSDCSGSCTASFSNHLAHTKGVSKLGIANDFDTESVENSPNVAATLACELANCANTGQGNNLVRLAAAEEEQPSQATRQDPTPSFVPHEVKAVWSNPTQGAAFGVPFTIHLAIPYERVGSVHVNQWDSKNEHNEDYDTAVEKAADGNTLVNVIPLNLNKTEFTLEADLGFLNYSEDRFILNVAPPPVRPLTFWPDQNLNAVRMMRPEILHIGQTAPLDPVITLASLPDKELYIKRYATFRAIQDASNPVVDLHPDGSFTALREGKAAIEVNFVGYTTSLTVEVNQRIPLLMP